MEQFGELTMTSHCTLKTQQLGDLVLIANPTHLIGLYFADCEHVPAELTAGPAEPDHPILRQAVAQVEEYLAGKRKTFSVPLHYDGTVFQQAIWRQIAQVPFGETISYTTLAQRARAPNAHRAAGTATGQNRIGIIIPCHRIVGQHGGLGGYAGGLQRKMRLLQLEGIQIGPQPRYASTQPR
jgi:methylated-DNA-[protein]-cysteine S-methyltransferase